MASPKIQIPTVRVAPTEEIRLITLPSTITREEKLAVLSCLISSMSRPFGSHHEVVELILNIFHFGLPGLVANGGALTSVTLKVTAPPREEVLAWAGLEPPPQGYKPGSFPLLPAAPAPDAMGVTTELPVYAGLAILLFCMGRQASESAKASVMDNRPDALIRRFDIHEGQRILLPGQTAGPARGALEQVYNAFANYAELRGLITAYFIGLQRSGQHLPLHLEVLMTNFNLMRGAGMTHVEAIIRLAQMHPWTLKVPQLRPFYERFLSDLEKFSAVPADVRPYHRLLVSQSDYLFLSSELRPLIAVAGSFIEEVEKTFGGYVYNKTAYQPLIDEVKSRAPNYNPTTGLARLAALLGVVEEPLPARSAARPAPTAGTV